MSPSLDPGIFVGVMGLEDDARVDFGGLRADHAQKYFPAWKGTLGALLRRPGTFATCRGRGTRTVRRAAVRPVAVAIGNRRVHLLSTWDEGMPPEISRDDLSAVEPCEPGGGLAELPGLRDARE